jgi:toxin FitB
MYVLDTNVVSATRVPVRNPMVADWLRGVNAVDVYVTAITIAEIEQGIRLKERDDPTQGKILREWFEQRVIPAFVTTSRILDFNTRAARIYGKYPIPEFAPKDDALIAAIAAANGMIVVTRNVKHFEPLGVPVINPWG